MRRTRLVVVATSAVAIATGCAWAIFTGANSQATTSNVTTLGAASLVTAQLPAGYQRPGSMATASDGSVWFWSDSNSEASLFHWVPSSGGGPSKINLGSPSSLGLVTGIQNAISVDSSGIVWIAANQTLVSYDPQSGAIQRISIPQSGVDPAVGNQGPSELANVQAVTSMAAGPSQQLAIATSNSNAMQILNTATGGFQHVPLPSGTEATDVSYNTDGSLGVAETAFSNGSSNGSIAILHNDGSRISVPGIGTTHITPAGSGFLANDSQQKVDSSGNLLASAMQTGVATTGGESIAAQPGGWSAVSSGTIAYTSAAGIVAVRPDGSVVVTKLPAFNCSGMSVPYGATPPNSATCPERATVLTGGASGLYAVLTSPVSTVAFLSSSNF
jgi:hypothetical protein